MAKKKNPSDRTRKASATGRAKKGKRPESSRKSAAQKKSAAARKRKKVTPGPKRTVETRRVTFAAPAGAPCIDLITAGVIVQNAIPGGPHDVDSTLEEAGLITPGQRITFRTDVQNEVEQRDCTIKLTDIPNGATTTLREARGKVSDKAQRAEP